MSPIAPPTPSSTRESFNEEDAADATAEATVQGRSSRSIPKSLVVTDVPAEVAQPLIEQFHYLHRMPAGVARCFGVYLNGDLCGAVVFSNGARQSHCLLAAGRPGDVVTLARLWLADALPKNSESRVLAIVLRLLRRTSPYKLVISYADPAAGHTGTIYRAAGWTALGQARSRAYLRLPDGRIQHPRSVGSAYGSSGVRQLRATGIAVEPVPVAGKHRYVSVLDPAWRWRLRHRKPSAVKS